MVNYSYFPKVALDHRGVGGWGASANRELGRVYNLRYLLIFFGTLLTEFIQCSRGRRYSEHHHDRSYEVRFHVLARPKSEIKMPQIEVLYCLS